jgi:hypothetical protein
VTYDQTEQAAENWDGGRDNPGQNPQRKRNANPRANGDGITLVHTVCTTEDACVDVLECDVAVDNTSYDNLKTKLAFNPSILV